MRIISLFVVTLLLLSAVSTPSLKPFGDPRRSVLPARFRLASDSIIEAAPDMVRPYCLEVDRSGLNAVPVSEHRTKESFLCRAALYLVSSPCDFVAWSSYREKNQHDVGGPVPLGYG